MLCPSEPLAVNFALTQKEDSDNTLVMTVSFVLCVSTPSFVLCVSTKACSLRCAMCCRARDCELHPDTEGRFGQHPGDDSKFCFMSQPRCDHHDVLCAAEPETVNFTLTQKEDSGNTLVMTVSFILCISTKVSSP